MNSDLIPTMRYDASTDTLEVFENGATQFASAQRSSTTTDAPILGTDPGNGVAAAEKRIAFLEGTQKPTHVGPDGKPRYALSAEQRAKHANELAHLRDVVMPFERQTAAALAERQAAALAERDERLRTEAEHRDEIERRAVELVKEREAAKLADRISADLKLR